QSVMTVERVGHFPAPDRWESGSTSGKADVAIRRAADALLGYGSGSIEPPRLPLHLAALHSIRRDLVAETTGWGLPVWRQGHPHRVIAIPVQRPEHITCVRRC